ncbi:hypothetical protein [Tenacibaculum crassostreae]|uniref:hypothetical protein n=1 Tax=Tenacibaculum crassostreae TaxID=502683 RepID=UPI003896164F
MKNKLLPQLFIVYLRYIIGFSFVFASIVKIQGLRFTSTSGELHAINTSWHFFETLYQSGGYWKFIGLGQLIAGLLLMTQRYAKLGAVLFLPIIANIFVITVSYDFRGTPFITGAMFLATILLIIWDWNTFKVLINKPQKIELNNRLENYRIWEVLGFSFFIITLLSKFIISKTILMPLFLCLPLLGIIVGIIGIRKYKRQQTINVNSTT